jgi:uncharacterized protein YggE
MLFVMSLLVLSSLLTACATGASAQATTPTAQTGEPRQVYRTLSVSGSGKVSMAPDIAYINIGVHSEGSSAAETVKQNNEQTAKVIAALKAFGVAEKDIHTINFSIYPQQQYDFEGKPTGEIKYMVDNTVNVTARDLDKLGDLLDAAVQAGANSISGIQFDVEDKSAAYSQARKAAIANARAIAEELAQAAGVSLGAVQTISVYGSSPVAVEYQVKLMEAPMLADASSVPVSPGEMVIIVEASVVYEIQ